MAIFFWRKPAVEQSLVNYHTKLADQTTSYRAACPNCTARLEEERSAGSFAQRFLGMPVSAIRKFPQFKSEAAFTERTPLSCNSQMLVNAANLAMVGPENIPSPEQQQAEHVAGLMKSRLGLIDFSDPALTAYKLATWGSFGLALATVFIVNEPELFNSVAQGLISFYHHCLNAVAFTSFVTGEVLVAGFRDKVVARRVGIKEKRIAEISAFIARLGDDKRTRIFSVLKRIAPDLADEVEKKLPGLGVETFLLNSPKEQV